MSNNAQLTALALAIQARVPMILVSEPGAGKTKTIEAIVKQLDEPLATFIPVVHEPQDIGGYGVPVTENGHTRIKLVLVGGWLDKILAQGKGTIFIDEITCSPLMMQAACLRPLDSRMIGEEQLSKDVAIVMACNPPEIAAGGTPISPPMANRLVWLDWTVDVDETIEGFVSGWSVPQFPRLPSTWREDHFQEQASLVGAFFKTMSHHIHQFPKDEDTRSGPWPSKRSWYDLAVPMLAACEATKQSWTIKLLLLSGCVGTGTAREFHTWVKALDLPDPADLLKDPGKFKVYHDLPDKTFAVLNSVVSLAVRTLGPDTWKAGWEILAAAAKDNAADLAGPAARNLAIAREGKALPLYPELTAPFRPILLAQTELRATMAKNKGKN